MSVTNDSKITSFLESNQGSTSFDLKLIHSLAAGSFLVTLANLATSSYVSKTYDTSQTLYWILKIDCGVSIWHSVISVLIFLHFSVYPETSQVSCFFYLQGLPLFSVYQPYITFWISLIR